MEGTIQVTIDSSVWIAGKAMDLYPALDEGLMRRGQALGSEPLQNFGNIRCPSSTASIRLCKDSSCCSCSWFAASTNQSRHSRWAWRR